MVARTMRCRSNSGVRSWFDKLRDDPVAIRGFGEVSKHHRVGYGTSREERIRRRRAGCLCRNRFGVARSQADADTFEHGLRQQLIAEPTSPDRDLSESLIGV